MRLGETGGIARLHRRVRETPTVVGGNGGARREQQEREQDEDGSTHFLPSTANETSRGVLHKYVHIARAIQRSVNAGTTADLVLLDHVMRFRLLFFASMTPLLAQSASADEVDTQPERPPEVAPQKPLLFWELAADTRYVSPPIRGGTTPFGAGFGGHTGISIPSFYIGARVQYFLGATDIDISNEALVYGLDLGYGFHLARLGGVTLTLRPLIGVGGLRIYHTDPSTLKNAPVDVVTTASGRSSSRMPSATITVDNLYVEPSLQLTLQSGLLFVSVGGSTMVIPSIGYGGQAPMTWVTWGMQGSIGIRL